MRPRMIALASLALAAACGGHTAPAAVPAAAPAPPGDPTALRYTPGTGRYRIEQTQQITQEAMGQLTRMDGSSTLLVSASLTPSDSGGLLARFTVDSVTASSTIPGASAALEAVRGRTFRATFTPLGRATSFSADSTDATGQGNVFREFLPALPAGTLVPGTRWTDTLAATQPGGRGMEIHTRSVRQHSIVGWEAHDGTRALRVSVTGSYTISGSGQAQGQEMRLTGTGAASADLFVSPSGVYLGGTVADSAAMTVTLVAMGLEVPIHQSRHIVVSRLP